MATYRYNEVRSPSRCLIGACVSVRLVYCKMVRVERFELPTPPPQTECAGQTALHPDKWSARRISKSQPLGPQPSALPLSYAPLKFSPIYFNQNRLIKMVGVEDFETSASRTRNVCSASELHPDGGWLRYRTGLSGFSDQRFHLISLPAASTSRSTRNREPDTDRDTSVQARGRSYIRTDRCAC